jgi:hypothetical protein
MTHGFLRLRLISVATRDLSMSRPEMPAKYPGLFGK